MIETIEERPQAARVAARRPAELPQPLTALGATAIERIPVPISELDRVLGGGLVPGTLVLIGGGPGVGKATPGLPGGGGFAGGNRPGLFLLAGGGAQPIRAPAARPGGPPRNGPVLPG